MRRLATIAIVVAGTAAATGVAGPASAAAALPGEQLELTPLAGPFSPRPPVLAATAMPGGGAVAVVSDRSGPFLGSGPAARLKYFRLTADGELAAPVRTLPGEVEVIGPDPGLPGGVVVITADSVASTLHAQALDAAGAPSGAPIDLGRGSQPAVAFDAARGRVVLAYQDGDPGSLLDLETTMVRELGAGGAPLGPPVAVSSPDRGAREPAIAIGPGGGLVVWAGSPIAATDLKSAVLARPLDAAGAPVGAVTQLDRARVPVAGRGSSEGPESLAVAADPRGGRFVVSWSRIVSAQRGGPFDDRQFGLGVAVVGAAGAPARVFEPAAKRPAAIFSHSHAVIDAGGTATIAYTDAAQHLAGLRLAPAGITLSPPFAISAVRGTIGLLGSPSVLPPLGGDRHAALFAGTRPDAKGRAVWLRVLPARAPFDARGPRATLRGPATVRLARLAGTVVAGRCDERCAIVVASANVLGDPVTISSSVRERRVRVTARPTADQRDEIRRSLAAGERPVYRIRVVLRDALGNLGRADGSVRITRR